MDCFSCFREPGFERLTNSLETEQEQEHKHRSNNHHPCTFPDKPLMMLRSSWKKGKHLQEKKPKQQEDVEDWVMAFSLLNNNANANANANNGGGVNMGFHFKLSSKRVFLPYLKTTAKEDVGKEGKVMEEVPLEKTQSWKPKKKKNKDKRVTFRLPEEADIFIFDSTPQEEAEGMLYVF
ncbi:hypothetical protein V6N13_013275 [Hibiscus sabdariffa]|uniref:Uncharacterized protein n=1 Tax=Hibiscus sabdariffa TaxID=183260 RepID=A0ABR2SIG6_9ROSI